MSTQGPHVRRANKGTRMNEAQRQTSQFALKPRRCRSSSLPQKRCSWNASSAAPHLIPWLCDITPRHHVTRTPICMPMFAAKVKLTGSWEQNNADLRPGEQCWLRRVRAGQSEQPGGRRGLKVAGAETSNGRGNCLGLTRLGHKKATGPLSSLIPRTSSVRKRVRIMYEGGRLLLPVGHTNH